MHEGNTGSETSSPPKFNILLVDDEQDILKSLTRVLRLEYHVTSFDNAPEAIEHLKSHSIAVIISDMRMPEMDGAKFLADAKEISPDSARLLLTGYSDMESTVRAVNLGGIHNYIDKPWDNETLKKIVANAAEIFQLKQDKLRLTNQLEVKNEQLETLNSKLEEKVAQRTKQLHTTNKKLQNLLKNQNLAFKDMMATLRAIIEHCTGQPQIHRERIANIAKAVAKRLELADTEVALCYLAGLVHQIGLVHETDANDNKPVFKPSSSMDVPVPISNPIRGADIISQIARFEPMVKIIRHQDENYDGTGYPNHLVKSDIPIGARILRIAKSYEFFISNPDVSQRMTPEMARAYIKRNTNKLFDPHIAKAFRHVVENETTELDVDACIGVDELREGMKLKQDLYLPNGKLMLTSGQIINRHMLEKLQQIKQDGQVPIVIFV